MESESSHLGAVSHQPGAAAAAVARATAVAATFIITVVLVGV